MKQDRKAVIYCRVSTEEQEANGTSLDTQEATCRRHAEASGYEVVRVVREARSGASLARSGLDAVRDMAKRREVQAIIVAEQDRLSRNLAHTYFLMEEFEEARVLLLFVNDPHDLSAEGKMLFGMKGLFKDYERAKIAERTRRGKRQRSHEGRVLPGARITYGYRYSDGRYEIAEPEAATVRLIYSLLIGQHMSCNKVANTLTDMGIRTPGGGKFWRRTTVHRILCNETYTGLYRWGKYEAVLPITPRKDSRERKREKSAQHRRDVSETIPVRVPSIIDREAFERAQMLLRTNKSNSLRNERHPYLLRGMVFCARCGRRYGGSYTHGARVYSCPSNRDYDRTKRCGARQYQADTLEQAAWDGILSHLGDPESLLENMSTGSMEIEQELDGATLARLDEEAAEAQRKDQRMMEAYEAGVLTLDEWRDYRAKAQPKQDQIAADQAAIEERKVARSEVMLTAEQVSRLRAWFVMHDVMPPSFDEKRRMLERLGARITVDGERALLTGLITETTLDLEEAAVQSRLQRQAWDDLLHVAETMRAEGRQEEAEEFMRGNEQARANGTLILSITPPPGAIVCDTSDDDYARKLGAFMSPSSR